MRIGILTFWQTLDNYGQVLQAYALQQVLLALGHEPYIIRYDLENRPYKESMLKKISHVLLFPLYRLYVKKKETAKSQIRNSLAIRQFDAFRSKHFVFSDNIYKSLKQLKKNPPQADCYIAGSDQVWGHLLSYRENRAFFLDFGDKNIKRIAYAPSFGRKDYPTDLHAQLRVLLSRFDAISCRELDGVNICKSVGIEAEKVLDPTLIAPLSIYEQFIEKEKKKSEYVYIYSLNIKSPEEIGWTQLKGLCKTESLKVLVTTGTGYCRGERLYDEAEYEDSTISQWLSNIYNAKMVVTTSFHGIVFCLLFHKHFVYIPLKGSFGKGNNRVLDLLRQCSLMDRCLKGGDDYTRLLESPIEWTQVDCILMKEKTSSVKFLKKSLCAK